MKRRAPEGGYIGGVKNQYRRNVWASFREAARRQGWSRSFCDVLLMPSAEGKEIEVAEDAGFRRNRMHVVDKNPAIVAHLSRRYPGILTYGCSIERAAERIASAGVRLKFANLDLCGFASKTYQRDLVNFMAAECLDEMSYLAITMLRGREQQTYRDYMGNGSEFIATMRKRWPSVAALSDSDITRVAFVGATLAYRGDQPQRNLFPARVESYKSTAGNQTMLWSMWQVITPPGSPWRVNMAAEQQLAQMEIER
jgi:hypothetical protein